MDSCTIYSEKFFYKLRSAAGFPIDSHTFVRVRCMIITYINRTPSRQINRLYLIPFLIYLEYSSKQKKTEQYNLHAWHPTIWCTNCAILLTKNGKKKWCTPCMSFRDTLRSQLSRLKHMETHPDRLINPYSHTAYKHLDREELSSRLRKVHQLQLSSAQKVKKLTTSHCGKDGTFH